MAKAKTPKTITVKTEHEYCADDVAACMRGVDEVCISDTEADDQLNDFLAAHEDNITDLIAKYIIENWGQE